MKKTSIGFGADLKDRFDEEENIIAQVTNEDLREYGFIPEFIGRLPMIFTLEGLTKGDVSQDSKRTKGMRS